MSSTPSGPIELGKRHLDDLLPKIRGGAVATAIVGVLVTLAMLLAFEATRANFWHNYLVAVTFWLAIALGGLWFVILQHLVKAGWSVVVRRVAEGISLNVLWMPLLIVPVVIAMSSGDLHHWPSLMEHAEAAEHGGEAAAPGAEAGGHHGVEAIHGEPVGGFAFHDLDPSKADWLSLDFFIGRLVLYFMVWIGLAVWFHRTSVAQDASREVAATRRMELAAPFGMILFALTSSLAGFDLLMSLDPFFFSTIFGIYFFSGAVLTFFATMIVCFFFLQRHGIVNEVSPEHYHDLGKLMFGFVIFWAYIAFSQFMLIWYGNIPEETWWFVKRTSGEWWSGWRFVSVWLIVGHFFIPFLLLMSRFPKRNPHLLVWGAVWVLAVHYVDVFWLVLPEASPWSVPFPLDTLALGLVVGALFAVATASLLKGKSLIPEGDPRLGESLRFENY